MVSKRLFLFVLLVFSLPAFSETHFDELMNSTEDNSDQIYLNDINRGNLTYLPNAIYLGPAYALLVDELAEHDCNDLQQVYDIVTNWDDQFTLPVAIENNVNDEYIDDDQ